MWWQVKCGKWPTLNWKPIENYCQILFIIIFFTDIPRPKQWLNRASVIVHGELINVGMLQLFSSMKFTTWVGLMLSVHGKNGMHLIFLGNLLLKYFLQQSQDIQPYSNNQIKASEKRCILNSECIRSSLVYAGCLAPSRNNKGESTCLNRERGHFFRRIYHYVYCCWTTRVYQTRNKGGARNCKSNKFFNCRSEQQSLLAFSEEKIFLMFCSLKHFKLEFQLCTSENAGSAASYVISDKCSIVLLIFYTLEYAPLCSKDKGQIDDLILPC